MLECKLLLPLPCLLPRLKYHLQKPRRYYIAWVNDEKNRTMMLLDLTSEPRILRALRSVPYNAHENDALPLSPPMSTAIVQYPQPTSC